MVREISIAGRSIGHGKPCYVIAEAGVNHNGDLNKAFQLVDAAADAGADAVKFQTFSADRLAADDAPLAEYQKQATGESGGQLEMLRRLQLTEEDHRKLLLHCRSRGIQFLSTPFDEECADFLESLDVPGFKVSSGDLTNLPLLDHIARKGRPMILSTGMADLDEVVVACQVIHVAGGPDLAILHCVTNYPTDPKDANLRAMATLAERFQWPVGFSDHTLGLEIAWASVALGATILEKHFTLDRTLPGPDHQASLEPAQLKELVVGLRRVEAAIGDGVKQPRESEKALASVARKSLYWRCDLPAGEIVAPRHLIALRPAVGLPPGEARHLIGQPVRRAVRHGTRVELQDMA